MSSIFAVCFSFILLMYDLSPEFGSGCNPTLIGDISSGSSPTVYSICLLGFVDCWALFYCLVEVVIFLPPRKSGCDVVRFVLSSFYFLLSSSS